MKMLRKNIIGFVIGGIIFGSIGVTIALQILATQVNYTNTKSIEGVTNVDGALTELYGLAETCINNASSGSDVTYKGSAAEAVYLDPTGNRNDCSSSNFSSTASSGCFRFYVYAEDSEYKYAILDHNTTPKVSSCTNNNCFAAAQSQVKQDTANWNPNLQARNISAMEVYKITESTNNKSNWQINNGVWFHFNQKNGNNGRDYGWLFDRTNGCTSYGCTTSDSSNDGYWMSDAYSSSRGWCVTYNGRLDHSNFNDSLYGVRPVIQIAKS